MIKNLLALILIGLIGCTKVPPAQEIVDQAIDFSGTEKLKNASVAFDFRSMIKILSKSLRNPLATTDAHRLGKCLQIA